MLKQKPFIPGGYVLLSRKIIESEVWNKPPLYIKVWLYILAQARYREHKNLQRGEFVTSYNEIAEACSYKVGYRKMKPKKDDIRRVIEWLRLPKMATCDAHTNTHTNDTMKTTTNTTMITTTKVTQGLLIKVCNYNVYQDPKNYEQHSEDHSEDHSEATTTPTTKTTEYSQYNKESKRKKKEKKENTICPYQDIVDLYHKYCVNLTRVHKLTDKRKRQIRARWLNFNKDLSVFERVFKAVHNSPFHQGANDKRWRATIDWIVKNEENMLYFLERESAPVVKSSQSKKPSAPLSSVYDELKKESAGR